jgi:hypothetical protein
MLGVMSSKMKWILIHPWIAHIVSFICMVGFACPMYRLRAGSSVGLFRYGLDSLNAAIMLPGFGVVMFLPIPFLDIVTALVIWGLSLWPLFHSNTKRGLALSYLVLIPLWGCYALGWILMHSFRCH